MAISNKPRIAMAVIVLVGLLGGAAVLRSERVKTGGEDAAHVASKGGRGEAHAEGEGGGHEKEARGKGTPEQGQPEKGHPEKGEHATGQVALTHEQLAAAGITVRAAGPAKLQAAARFPVRSGSTKPEPPTSSLGLPASPKR